jgi:hypothetical protein
MFVLGSEPLGGLEDCCIVSVCPPCVQGHRIDEYFGFDVRHRRNNDAVQSKEGRGSEPRSALVAIGKVLRTGNPM